jgi:exopolyphosphatase / guanosine-5'-triphosphate,3'-diphosphate pyrophosphatase
LHAGADLRGDDLPAPQNGHLMRVGVIDVGSNTVRLLVADTDNGTVKPVREERTALGLARDIEATGGIGEPKIRRAGELAKKYAGHATKAGATVVEVLVTAPGRQSENGDELVATISSATGLPVHGLTAEEEGRYAFAGVVASLPAPPSSLTVCDVGGGSTQLVFGTGREGPVWFRSLDFGSLRLAQRCFANDPPIDDELAEACRDVERAFLGLAPPLPRVAFATGGTARGVRRLAGRTLGPKQLAKATTALRKRRAAEIAEQHNVPIWRAQTLLAGVLVLAEAQRRLGVPLVVARAGLREGAALELAAAARAAA